MFLAFAMFFARMTVPVISMARKNTADGRCQEGNAYKTRDEFHTFSRFVLVSGEYPSEATPFH